MFKKGPAVVIAESDRRSSDAAATALRRTGYSTVEVKTGSEALELARREEVDLLVLEVTLPDMTGYEVCRTLRDEGDDTPIFFLSGTHTDSVDRVAGLLLGADDYLAKPFDPNELVARAHRHIRRREASGTSRRHSAPRLTPREEQILKLLARGWTLKQVAAELTISPKTVGTHIQNLFAKFDVHHRAELVARAYALRLVEPETAIGPARRDRDST